MTEIDPLLVIAMRKLSGASVDFEKDCCGHKPTYIVNAGSGLCFVPLLVVFAFWFPLVCVIEFVVFV